MAGAALLLPPAAFSRGATFPANERVNLGHIGVGGRGMSLLNSFLQLDGSQSVAVCDPFLSRREQSAARIESFYSTKKGSSFRGVRRFHDFRELLLQPDIDAVVIATPDHWHVPIALAAVRAGKDLYVEKPLGVSVAENRFLRRAILDYGRVFQYGTQQRSGRDFRFACELVRNGRIGELFSIHAWCPEIATQEVYFHEPGGSMTPSVTPPGFDYDLWLGPAPWSPYTKDRCTCYGSYHHYDNSLGFIAGWGAHPLDIAQWGNDSDETAPISYQGSGEIASTGLYNTISAWDVNCIYANGVELRFMSQAWARSLVESYHPNFNNHGTTFLGSEGWVSVDRSGIWARPESLLAERVQPDQVRLTESTNHYQNFISAVRTRHQTVSPIKAAVQSDIICQLADIAVRKQRPIRWDPENETVINDAGAERMLRRSMRAAWAL